MAITDVLTATVAVSPTSALGSNGMIPIDKVLGMSKGDGEDSYSKNSGIQDLIVTKYVLPDLDRALERVRLPAQRPVVVADLGCSSGRNAIRHVELIVNRLRARLDDSATREFQAFFNDLPSNDFNNLFQLLSTDPRLSSEGRNVFAAGVAGSFYGRLFCASSVDVFFASASLHWMSKVPDEVLDKNSPAFNRDKIWTFGSSSETLAAYKKQSSIDLKNFLDSRAAELAPGGLMFFTCLGRSSPDFGENLDDPLTSLIVAAMEETWNDCIVQGLLTREQKDAFNIPSYYRSVQEVEEVAGRPDAPFELLFCKLSPLTVDGGVLWPKSQSLDKADKFLRAVRAVFSGLLEEHVGNDVAQAFLDRFHKLGVEKVFPVIESYRNQNRSPPLEAITVAMIRK